MARLILAQSQGFFPLVIEGDSQIIINMVIKILQGTPSSKLSSSWRMAKRLELIEFWLIHNRAITLKHIQREGNKVADLLANIRVDCGVILRTGSTSGIASATQLLDFQNIVKKEGEEPPDAGESIQS